jgi:hypothetical protein
MKKPVRLPLIAIAAAALALSATFAEAQSGAPPYQVIETGQGFGRLQDAVNAIGNARFVTIAVLGIRGMLLRPPRRSR